MSRPRGEASWPEDAHVFHGATCTWWGSRREAAVAAWGRPNAGLPCCPLCGGALLDVRSEANRWRHVAARSLASEATRFYQGDERSGREYIEFIHDYVRVLGEHGQEIWLATPTTPGREA